MKADFVAAISQICSEKGIPQDVVIGAIEMALVSAYKRKPGENDNQNIVVRLDRITGQMRVFQQRQVVAEPRDLVTEIALRDARATKSDVRIGDVLEEEVTPKDFDRVAAMMAKQVVLQRLREAERDHVYDEFRDREGDIVSGVIRRLEGRNVVVDLGRLEATMPPAEQVTGETYDPNKRRDNRMKFYVVEIHRTPKGPQVIVSRAHRNLIRRLFELEVPEIYNGAVEIRSIAREAGSRSKVAVSSRQEGVDPVGSCVGQKGVRIQNILNELGNEKVDVILWNADSTVFVANSLSPAQVVSVELDEVEKTARILVPERQLSLAIGREGQNARLAAKLTGWRIDIKSAASAPASAEATEVSQK